MHMVFSKVKTRLGNRQIPGSAPNIRRGSSGVFLAFVWTHDGPNGIGICDLMCEGLFIDATNMTYIPTNNGPKVRTTFTVQLLYCP